MFSLRGHHYISGMKPPLVLLLGMALGLAAVAPLPLRAQSESIYNLKTTCSLGQNKPQPCGVEVVDVGDATEYRHRLVDRTISYRIIEDPHVRIEGRKDDGAD